MVTVMNNENWKKLIGSLELARTIADINGDGHLQLQDWRGLVSFYSKIKQEIDAVSKRFELLFGIKGRIYIDKRGKGYKLFFISKPLAQFLHESGAAEGNKTNRAFPVPKWIVEGDKESKRAYLKGTFVTEGYIYSTKIQNNKIRWRIGLEQYKNEAFKESGKKYMEQIRNMLHDFGIKSSPVRLDGWNIRKDGTKSVGLRFDIEKKYFTNFYKEIGFENKIKTKRLVSAMRGQN
jgi:tRNA-splicing ligase RtcB